MGRVGAVLEDINRDVRLAVGAGRGEVGVAVAVEVAGRRLHVFVHEALREGHGPVVLEPERVAGVRRRPDEVQVAVAVDVRDVPAGVRPDPGRTSTVAAHSCSVGLLASSS